MKIQCVFMDVDGTLTDGKVYMGENGEVFKAFNIKDGCGIHDILILKGVDPIIITGRSSKILEKRCQELGITEMYQGVSNKLEKLKSILQEKGLQYYETAYIGDDINDIECMQQIKSSGGIVGCPADSSEEILNLADYVCVHVGGDGAVREFIEWLNRENRL